MVGVLIGQVNVKRDNVDGAITGCIRFRGARLCLQGNMVDFVPFGALAMKIIGLGIDRLRLKLRIMSDDDLWWIFLNHREECSHEFWEELETRKAAGTLFKDSPFWTMGELARYSHPR